MTTTKMRFKILNSWGQGLGRERYGWIDYAFFPQVVMQAFVIYDMPTPRRAVAALDNSAESDSPAASQNRLFPRADGPAHVLIAR
jgi:C1A family cysteine protease